MKRDPHMLRALLLAAAALPLAPLAAQAAQDTSPETTTTAETPAPAPKAEAVTIDAPPAPEVPDTTAEATAEPETPAPAVETRTTTTRTTTRRTVRAPAAPAPVFADPAPPLATGAPAAPLPADALPPPEVLPAPEGPVAVDTVEPVEEPEQQGGNAWLLWVAAAAVLAGAIFLLLRHRRRSDDGLHSEDVREHSYEEPAPAAPVAAAPLAAAPQPEPERADDLTAPVAPAVAASAAAPFVVSSAMPARGHAPVAPLGTPDTDTQADTAIPAAAAAAEAGRPWLDLALRPVRAGVEGADARVEFELAVENEGNAAAEDVRVSAWMFPAGAAQESESERMLIEGAAEPALPPTTIEAGAGKKIEAAVELSTAEVAGDSVLPVVVAEARYRLPDGSEGRTAVRFAVGVPDGEELAYFATDNPSGLHEGVVARPLGEVEKA